MQWKRSWLRGSPLATPQAQKKTHSSFHGHVTKNAYPSTLGHLGRNLGRLGGYLNDRVQPCGKPPGA